GHTRPLMPELPMNTLYPDIKPYASRRLKVSDLHELYVEECGVPDGIPVLFVHGGPGAGCNARHRCFFDHYGPVKMGDLGGRINGVLVSMVQGKTLAFSLFSLQERGRLFIDP